MLELHAHNALAPVPPGGEPTRFLDGALFFTARQPYLGLFVINAGHYWVSRGHGEPGDLQCRVTVLAQ